MPKFNKCDGGVWLVSHKLGMVISPPCGRKSCPRCARQRRKVIIMRIMSHIADTEDTHDYWFMTITPHRNSIWGGWSQKCLQSGWSKLRKRMARRFRGELYWVFVREMTSGSKEFTDAPPFAHGHIIIGIDRYRNFVPLLTEELSNVSVEVGLGWKCLVGFADAKDVPMDNLKVARYVAKYATKAGQMEIARSISYSQNWHELGENTDNADDNAWELLNLHETAILSFLEVTGYHCNVPVMDDSTISEDTSE